MASYQYRYSLSTLACPTDLHAGEGGGAVLLDDTDDIWALAELRPGQAHSAAMAAEQKEQQFERVKGEEGRMGGRLREERVRMRLLTACHDYYYWV